VLLTGFGSVRFISSHRGTVSDALIKEEIRLGNLFGSKSRHVEKYSSTPVIILYRHHALKEHKMWKFPPLTEYC